ncbi:aminodeoxychorismate synthase component I [Pseudomonas kunmingensis]|uniref:aminodeoxychorismate synthase component I n=1 Tax=Stutzerimonas kunmingensis TaxID=1211807 RepID=UPI0015E4489F|nr:aminodeoxychorismate synthase component I [Stutzerimonas kunmingensis]MBA1238320.1 aminodeoxychorismate synthase component I [Stutzerimonas kunmingensis]MDH2245671.1 aminodeoxychorismate synthase component I [Pseudomonas sp. GD03856]MDH2264639.1 aminodeoxychorismate synthase component I [Pseudomonas sp. GD03855]
MSICTLHPLPYQADPAHWFARIRRAPSAVLLDSGRPKADRGRFDILSAWPLDVLEPRDDESGRDFFQRLRQALRGLGPAELSDNCELPFAGGLIGLLSYDFGTRLETLPQRAADDSGLPLARFGLYGWALISDHQTRTSQLVFHPATASSEQKRLIALFDSAPTAESAPFRLHNRFAADLSVHSYRNGIERIQTYIQAGDCYQVNFTQRFRAGCSGDPWSAYRALREACPTPYAGFVALEDGAIASLSPERFLRLQQGNVETRPIKGTRPRGADERSDAAQAQALLASDKDRAENLMIVDLLRNDLGRSCRIGSVRVPQLFALESYPNVHHLVSCVTGELADDHDAFDLLAGSFPGGSITGAPKIRAMQIIDELEPTRRSIYCGSLLYVDVRGEMDSSIAIRTLLIREGQASCWGGGGIVADSDWQAEYQESIDKVSVLMRTLEGL